MTDVEKRSHVIIMTKANQPYSVDPTLRRFDLVIDFGIPDTYDRLQMNL